MSDAIIQQASARQALATRPEHSIFVSANAGTGKTRVLTHRLLAIFLNEPELSPASVLALTFTKAAANEMANRLREYVQKLKEKPNSELKDALAEILNCAPEKITQTQCANARHLYARLFESVPGLTITTLHGWCQQLLQRFPIEAGLTPGFQVVEGAEQQELLDQALAETLASCARDGDADLLYFATEESENSLRSALMNVLEQPDRFRELFQNSSGAKGALAEAARGLELDAELTPEEASQHLQESALSFIPLFKAYIPQLLAGGVTMQKIGDSFAKWCILPDEKKLGNIHLITHSLFTQKIETKKLPKDIKEEFFPVQEAFLKLIEKQSAISCLFMTKAYLNLAEKVLNRYEFIKNKSGCLDFDELQRISLKLLNNESLGAWVRYRLDAQISHVLLDEGQDVDPTQAAIIRTLTEEFFSGAGQHESPRTLFAVGDMKQAIYRFRGGRPDVFAAVGHSIENAAEQGVSAEVVHLDTSFRSAPAILKAADDVCGPLAQKLGVTDYAPHQAAFSNRPGRVELWPLVTEKEEKVSQPEWGLPKLQAPSGGRTSLLAKKVARHCQLLLSSSRALACEEETRAINPEDILILFQSRGRLMQAVIAELNKLRLPHTGADKFNLKSDVIAQDLAALGGWVLAPHDDLKLAQILRSPMFGWSDVQLREAVKCEGETLWQKISGALEAGILQEAISLGRSLSPQAFYSQIVDMLELRGKYLCAVAYGLDSYPQELVDDVFDLWLQNVRKESDLAQFLTRFKRSGIELKREQEKGFGAIRLQTAHGAKGLEAPIVILPDSTVDNERISINEKLMWIKNSNKEFCSLLYPSKLVLKPSFWKRLVEQEKSAKLEDASRLLYVAMTRAKEELIICGAPSGNGEKIPENSWYSWASNAAESWNKEAELRTVHMGEWPTAVSTGKKDELPEMENIQLHAPKTVFGLPVWKKKQANLGEVFGEAVHKLLEILPQTPQEDWPKKAEQIALLWQLPKGQMRSALEQAKAVLQQHADLFVEGSQSEMPILTPKGQLMRLDLLVEREAEVLIIDFKTSVDPTGQTPAEYIVQLKKYVSAVTSLYPGRTIKAGLLWVSEKDQQNKPAPRLEWLVEQEGKM
jgi:ATP-dependent helicase/nuclease subunit A